MYFYTFFFPRIFPKKTENHYLNINKLPSGKRKKKKLVIRGINGQNVNYFGYLGLKCHLYKIE